MSRFLLIAILSVSCTSLSPLGKGFSKAVDGSPTVCTNGQECFSVEKCEKISRNHSIARSIALGAGALAGGGAISTAFPDEESSRIVIGVLSAFSAVVTGVSTAQQERFAKSYVDHCTVVKSF